MFQTLTFSHPFLHQRNDEGPAVMDHFAWFYIFDLLQSLFMLLQLQLNICNVFTVEMKSEQYCFNAVIII